MDDHFGRDAASAVAARRRRICTPRVGVAAVLVVVAVAVVHGAATAQPASGEVPAHPHSAGTTLTPAPAG